MARGRIATVASLERRATALKTRATKLAARQKAEPLVGTRGQIPRIAVKYKSSYSKEEYTISASESAVKYFTLDALGIVDADGSGRAPAGMRPNMVFATRAKATPTVGVSPLSGTKRLDYSPEATKGKRNSYSAPLQADTIDEIKAKLQTIYTAKNADLGAYGSIRFVVEKFPISFV